MISTVESRERDIEDKIMRYLLLEANDIEDLESAVNEQLADGSKLVGGVSVAYASWMNEREGCENSTMVYVQAMTIEP